MKTVTIYIRTSKQTYRIIYSTNKRNKILITKLRVEEYIAKRRFIKYKRDYSGYLYT